MNAEQRNTEMAKALALEGLGRLSRGETAFRAACALYMAHMPDADEAEAEHIARRIAAAVRQYNEGMAAAEKDPEAWVNAQLDGIAGDRGPEGRPAALAAGKALMQGADGRQPSAEDAARTAEEDEAALRADILEAARESRLYGSLVAGMAEGAAIPREEGELCEIAVSEAGDEAVKTVLGMAAYLQAAREGEQETLPETAALGVSAGMDTAGAVRGRALGKISPEKAELVKTIITIVLVVLAVAAIFYAVLVLLPQLPALLPAAVQPYVKWLAPAIKHIGRFLPVYMTLLLEPLVSACGSAAEFLWALVKGKDRTLTAVTMQEEAAGLEEVPEGTDAEAETAAAPALREEAYGAVPVEA